MVKGRLLIFKDTSDRTLAPITRLDYLPNSVLLLLIKQFVFEFSVE